MKNAFRLIVGTYNPTKDDYDVELELNFNIHTDVNDIFALGQSYCRKGFEVVCEEYDTQSGMGTKHVFSL